MFGVGVDVFGVDVFGVFDYGVHTSVWLVVICLNVVGVDVFGAMGGCFSCVWRVAKFLVCESGVC